MRVQSWFAGPDVGRCVCPSEVEASMFRSFVRVFLGFLFACLAAGIVQLLFVHGFQDLAGVSADEAKTRLSDALVMVLAIATHSALFAAPFALIVAAIGEWLGQRRALFYIFAGAAIAGCGFYAEFQSEPAGAPTILNTYAGIAYAVTGAIAGWVYWYVAGQFAGGPDEPSRPHVRRSLSEMIEERAGAGYSEASASPQFLIEEDVTGNGDARLVSTRKLEKGDFFKVAEELGQEPFKARKISLVAGRKAEESESVVTKWNGKETANTAQPGDWVVTNLSPDKTVMRDRTGQENTYVIKAETFPLLYERVDGENSFGAYHRAKGHVEAIALPGGFEILAPWGQKQTADKGYLILNGKDIYGNNKETFETTYEKLS